MGLDPGGPAIIGASRGFGGVDPYIGALPYAFDIDAPRRIGCTSSSLALLFPRIDPSPAWDPDLINVEKC